ncbi:Ger(x)C family spore germination protein [Paenibacillus xanthanilyticus]|uniref:Ger(X)C family spore germination protein n=1 Tax=Paenibacillus xanthanilyticus TaxID=1783531 RepID=A0ABV8K6I1_9BACL
MKKTIAALFLCLTLTGCWDQIQLNNLLFIDVIGIDYAEGQSKKLKVNYVISSVQEANQGGGKPATVYVESSGVNLYDAVTQTNKELPGVLSVLETRLYLISRRFAKDEPLKHLDIASQFASNPLYAYLAMYDGDLSKLLAKNRLKDQTISNLLIGLLDDQIRFGTAPSNKLLHYILGGNQFMNDFALSRLEPYKEGARLSGTALFSNGRYTGINLNNEDTLLAALMDGTPGKLQLITGQWKGRSYSVLVQKSKRRIKVGTDSGKLREITISLDLQVKLVVDGDGLKKHTDAHLNETESIIEADLAVKMGQVLAALQKANCDFLQLGHEVAAFHPDVYKTLHWREAYPKLNLKPIVHVKIMNTAILD